MVVGDTLGPYRVLAKIGEGGMGQVFRARDTTLNRDVALKVLPDTFASDPERFAQRSEWLLCCWSLHHAVSSNFHVGRFEITVDDASLVRGLEGFRDLFRDGQRFLDGNCAARDPL